MFVDQNLIQGTKIASISRIRYVSEAEIQRTLSITIGWFAITSNWSIVPDRRNIYTNRLDKIMKFSSKWKMAERPSFHVTNFDQSDGVWENRAQETNHIWPALTQIIIVQKNVQDGGQIKTRFLSFVGRNWSTIDPVRYLYVST